MAEKQLVPLHRPHTLSEVIAERIVLAIASGETKPGERLTESQIAAAMSVSRVPVREALMTLTAKGILVPLEPRGLKVTDFSDSNVADIREVRLGLEEIGMKRAMDHTAVAPERLENLSHILEEMKNLADSNDILSMAQCDVSFHREIMRLADNELLLNIWQGLSNQLMILFCRDWHMNKDRIAEFKLHQTLFDLIKAGEKGLVHEVLNAHFSKS